MQYVEARVAEHDALRFFRRRCPRNLYGLLLPHSRQYTASGKQLPYLERIWIPHLIIDLRVVSHRGPGTVSVSLDACSGAFAFFQMHDALCEGELDGHCAPELIPEEEAIARARAETLKAILRRRGQQEKPAIEDTLGIDRFYYPFWCYYFLRRGRYIDLRLQDALTAERGGNRTRQGLLNAFVQEKENTPRV